MQKIRLALAIGFLLITGSLKAQEEQSLDKIVAVVGNNIIMYSDIMGQYSQYLNQGGSPNDNLKCVILDQLLTQKLLLNQAIIDSLVVQDGQVDEEMNRRVRYFTAQFGSQEKLEAFLGKGMAQFKEDLRGDIRDLLLAQQMQQSITKDVSVTPADVKQYYSKIPADSLPFYNTEVEIGEIIKYPSYSKEAKQTAREKLERIRERIVNGEDFATMAILYSQDGSARAGGELGFMGRGELVKAFEAVAFKLKPGDLSQIVETEFGLHLIEPIERRGEQVNVRHILIKPEYSEDDYQLVKKELDSVYTLITSKKIEFGEAATKFSDDLRTKNSGGLLLSPTDGSTKIGTDQLDASIFLVIDTMKIGNISTPAVYQAPDGKRGMRIIYYKSRTEPHRANLKDDYQKMQAEALSEKQNAVVNDWFHSKRKSSYVKIDAAYTDCAELKAWLKKDN